LRPESLIGAPIAGSGGRSVLLFRGAGSSFLNSAPAAVSVPGPSGDQDADHGGTRAALAGRPGDVGTDPWWWLGTVHLISSLLRDGTPEILHVGRG